MNFPNHILLDAEIAKRRLKEILEAAPNPSVQAQKESFLDIDDLFKDSPAPEAAAWVVCRPSCRPDRRRSLSRTRHIGRGECWR